MKLIYIGDKNMKVKLSCPCLFGLESVLSGEIKRMGGAENIITTDGRVTFEGDILLLAKANIFLRTAERVQILLGEFEATSFTELFDGVKALPLEEYIGKKDAFPVKGWSLNSALHSIPDCQAIIKKAAVDRLSSVYGVSWFEETEAKHQIQFAINKNNVKILLDTSGAGLHKRGYRKNQSEAPIKETLAAGMIDLLRVYDDTIFYDPFCGSGTFLIEAATHALKIAPGLKRGFIAEKWEQVPKKIWREARNEALSQIRRNASFKAYGSDLDNSCVELAISNAKIAGVDSRISIKQQDISKFRTFSDRATIITNPPYGERLLDVKKSEELYEILGKVVKPSKDVRLGVITPHEDFEKFFGQKANKKRKLYNGMLKCNYFMYR